ncbi:MAG TPA: glycosyltransferase family 4 protein [Burkholderiaceae bacterium]|nr:glycosyltransferase family 4 protein [Burkholderiaceae bacterium]
MNQETITRHLLEDALEQVLCNPTAAHCWHRLRPLYEAAPQSMQSAVCTMLAQHVDEGGVPGFLRASFLAFVTGEERWYAAASAALLALQPVDADRIAAHMGVSWYDALAGKKDRGAFVDAMRVMRMPALARRAGQRLAAHTSLRLPARAVTRVERVALVVPQLGVAGHAPTRMALAHGAMLQADGKTVELYCARELNIAQMPNLLGCGRTTASELPAPDAWSRALRRPMTIHLADERMSLLRRWSALLERMVAFDPDLILFVGLYSPWIELLYPQRPVLGLSVQSTAPIAPVDVWLAADAAQAGAARAPWGADMPPSTAWHYPYRVQLERAGAPLSRAALGLPASALVLVSVGYRLGEEIAGAWAARMVEMMMAAPDAVWLLPGCASVPAALQGLPPERVRAMGHLSNVQELLACCDICVNPPRMGGGLSVAQAMAAGLPVVAFAGSDGGDKIGAAAVTDSDAYFATLGRLMADPAARAAMGAAMRELFADTLDLARGGPALRAASEAALLLFQRRCAMPASS